VSVVQIRPWAPFFPVGKVYGIDMLPDAAAS
jgi:hypothetical protein